MHYKGVIVVLKTMVERDTKKVKEWEQAKKERKKNLKKRIEKKIENRRQKKNEK